MIVDPIFERVFRKLYGQACWGVKPGHGSFLTLEFGQPHLDVNEPSVSKAASPTVRRLLARRRIVVHGDWHLWIYCCDWEIFEKRRRIATSRSTTTYEKGTQALDGQKLLRFSLQQRGLHSTFEFDLGGVLITRPYRRKDEQWMLFEPSGFCLTLRGDVQFSYTRSDELRDAEPWRPIYLRTKS